MDDEKKPVKRKTTTKKSVSEETPKEVKKTTRKKAAPKKEETALVVKEEQPVQVVEEKEAAPKKKAAPRKKVEKPKEEVKEEVPEVVEEVKIDEKTVETPPVKEEVKEEQTVVAPVVQEEPKKEVTDDTIVAEPISLEQLGESKFDGKLIQLIGWYIIGFIVTALTLGLGGPFATCFILDWKFKHTKINGKRLCFDGNGLQLLGNYIKWFFFTVITLGIFLLFLPVQWNRWIVKHTHYEGNRKPKVNYSLFDGITWEYIGINILSGILNLFTFGLLKPFTDTLMYSWRINHTTYDTIDMEFDGKGFQLLGNYIKWTFFTIITLGIYGLWVPIKKIQWEVKHTHEKGYAKRPYRPVLGMILPILFCACCFGLELFGLLQVKKDTWIQIRDDIKHYVDSIVDECDKYDWDKVLARRGADMYYRASTRDLVISWSERYERYFDSNKVDKWADNTGDYFEGNEVEMAIVDVATSKQPVIIIKYNNQYRVFWLYEKKIENHYFNVNDGETGHLVMATDKKGNHLAYISELSGKYEDVVLRYIDRVVDYNADSVARGMNMKVFEAELEKKNITLNDVDLHFETVNMKNMSGFDKAVEYYKKHQEKKETEKKEEKEESKKDDILGYKDAYLGYLRENLNSDATVALLNVPSQDNPVLVVMGKANAIILSYFDNEVHVSEKIPKSSLATIKKSTKSSDDYVLVFTDSVYKYYYFVEAYAAQPQGAYEGQASIKVKKKKLESNLKNLKYKETKSHITQVSISKDDLSKLEGLLGE